MPLPIVTSPKIKHIIAVAAGKGGVGKSTVAVNLALLLRDHGHSVGVMDTDVYGPSIRRMLPEAKLPTRSGERMRPALTKEGIAVVSMAYFQDSSKASAVRAPIANRLVNQFLHGVEWGELDYLIIDFPPGTGDIQLTLAQQANLSGAVMVTTPQEVAAMDVRKAMNLFVQVSVPVLGVVENMSYYYHENSGERVALFGEGGGRRLAYEAGVPFLGELPVSPLISYCGDNGGSLFAIEGAPAYLIDAYSDILLRIEEQLAVVEAAQGLELRDFELIWKEMS